MSAAPGHDSCCRVYRVVTFSPRDLDVTTRTIIPTVINMPADILLIEPEKTLAEILAFRLELLGYTLRVVRTGGEAISELTNRLASLVIVNTKLPDSDGLEWVARTRHDWPQRDLPVLAISFDPSLETVERAFHAGADDYLVTPFDPTVLESKVHSLLQSNHLVARS